MAKGWTKPSTLVERYWKHVDPCQSNGCWGWIGATVQGYGVLGIGNGHGSKTMRANRVSWIIHFGLIPEGMYVLHKCDNPPCSNPDCLFLGSPAENMQDASAKGRLHVHDHHGAKNPKSKLTTKQVDEIRQLYASGLSQTTLAKQFGIGQVTVSRLTRGDHWTLR